MSRGTFHNLTSAKEWWEVSESNRNFPFITPKERASIQLIAFNDKVFPSELSILSGRGYVFLIISELFLAFLYPFSAIHSTLTQLNLKNVPMTNLTQNICTSTLNLYVLVYTNVCNVFIGLAPNSSQVMCRGHPFFHLLIFRNLGGQ